MQQQTLRGDSSFLCSNPDDITDSSEVSNDMDCSLLDPELKRCSVVFCCCFWKEFNDNSVIFLELFWRLTALTTILRSDGQKSNQTSPECLMRGTLVLAGFHRPAEFPLMSVGKVVTSRCLLPHYCHTVAQLSHQKQPHSRLKPCPSLL